jgi:L-galactose dehydrogenase
VRYNPLGGTSLRVSVLGFGCGPLGDEYGTLDPAAGRRAVDLAIDDGINFFDTAPYYGRTLSEARLGEFLRGKRDRVVLATKVGRYDRDLPEGFDFSAARVVRSVEQSLRRLRTEVIDLFQVHDLEFGDRSVILSETLPTMHRLKEEGKVRFIGITGYPLELLREVAEAGGVDTVLSYCHLNLLNTRLAEVLASMARERGIGLINASPLHMGVLTRQGPPPWHPAPPEVLRAARNAASWCAGRGGSIEDVALRFALGSGEAATTLVGMRDEREVRANLEALDGPPDPDLLSGVRAILEPVRDVDWPVGRPENNHPALRDGPARLGTAG